MTNHRDRLAAEIEHYFDMTAPRKNVVIPGGLEPPTYGLGNRRSVQLSYGTAGAFGITSRFDFAAHPASGLDFCA